MATGEKIARYIQPMLTTAVDKPFSNEDWLFELKMDGFRAIAELKKKSLLLYSRNGLSLADRYPAIVEALAKMNFEAVLDGEIVLLNEEGKPDFQKLQNYLSNPHYTLLYYVFDILSLHKKDLKHTPLLERKKILKKLLKKNGPILYCDHVDTKGEELFKMVKKNDMEGIIAKKKDSFYTPGMRTKEWLKIKNHQSQEAIIIGFTEPRGSRQHFGSVLLAQYKNRKLKYAGHVGTGFDSATLAGLMKKMKPLAISKSPLDARIKTNSPVTWLKPKLVCEVSYSEITRDGILRQPVFKGLRPGKKSTMIREETERPRPLKKLIHT